MFQLLLPHFFRSTRDEFPFERKSRESRGIYFADTVYMPGLSTTPTSRRAPIQVDPWRPLISRNAGRGAAARWIGRLSLGQLPPRLSLSVLRAFLPISLSPPFDPSFLVKKPRWVDSALSGGYFARFFLATSRSWRMKKRRRGRKGGAFLPPLSFALLLRGEPLSPAPFRASGTSHRPIKRGRRGESRFHAADVPEIPCRVCILNDAAGWGGETGME